MYILTTLEFPKHNYDIHVQPERIKEEVVAKVLYITEQRREAANLVWQNFIISKRERKQRKILYFINFSAVQCVINFSVVQYIYKPLVCTAKKCCFS